MRGHAGPFRRADRLLRSREFDHVARHGRRAVVRGFVLLAAASSGEPCSGPRLGVTVSRRVGNAVTRNRIRRRVREWFRRERSRLPRELDLVVIGRRDAAPFSGRKIWEQLDAGIELLEMGPSTSSNDTLNGRLDTEAGRAS